MFTMLHNVRKHFQVEILFAFLFLLFLTTVISRVRKGPRKSERASDKQAQEATQEYQSIIEKDSVHRSDPYLIDPFALVNQQLLPSRALISPILQ